MRGTHETREAPGPTGLRRAAPTQGESHVRAPAIVVSVDGLVRSFGARRALDDVSLEVSAGQIHALLGPNGAGKTTLVRILAGLLVPSAGRVRVLGSDAAAADRARRGRIGLVPSGDRSFYLRISGLENLVFFARLHGLRRRSAVAAARDALERVGLSDAARVRVGEYSHGMQKRLSIARALLTEPALLLVDEATHDLDPDGARIVRELVGGIASRGAAVVWATQRIDEIRGFADRVSLLRSGTLCFSGTVSELMARAVVRRHLVQLRNGRPDGRLSEAAMQRALASRGSVSHVQSAEPNHYVLALAEGVSLGEALAALTGARIEVLSCRAERSEIEEAFLYFTGGTR